MPKKRRPSGVAVDSSGGPVVDPTKNVIDLNEASVKRLDDLAAMGAHHNREVSELRTRRTDDMAELRATHARQMAAAEASRIDAILVNVSDTAQITAAAAETRAGTLANTVSLSADAMRAQVASTAQASNETLDRRFGPIQASIEEIRKFQFETQGGRQQTTETRERSANYGLWVGIAVAVFIGLNTLLMGVVGMAVTYMLNRPK